MAAANGSAVVVGSSTVDREPACSAIIDAGGQAISSCEPRRTASCTVATRPGDAPSLAITTTRSSAPTQPGRPWVGQATNGTGQTGSSMARMKRASVPAAITARGRGSPCSRPIGSAGSAVSRRSRAPASASRRRIGSAPARAWRSSSQESSKTDMPQRGGESGSMSGRRASSISSTGMPCRTG